MGTTFPTVPLSLQPLRAIPNVSADLLYTVLCASRVAEFLISPEVPLIDSAKVLSRPMIGRWETVLTRSDSLEKLFRAFGIPYFKRVVVDKLAIPLDIEFEVRLVHSYWDFLS